MAGHWEVRRRLNETDADVNRKMHLALSAGLRPVVLVGDSRSDAGPDAAGLSERLDILFADCESSQVARMAVVYEPETAHRPAPNRRLQSRWPGDAASCETGSPAAFGSEIADKVPIVYGGSVAPENAPALLASADIDGLGAGRQGRIAEAFARIVTTTLPRQKKLLPEKPRQNNRIPIRTTNHAFFGTQGCTYPGVASRVRCKIRTH